LGDGAIIVKRCHCRQPGASPRQAAVDDRCRLGAIRDIGTRQHRWANRVSEGIEAEALRTSLDLLRTLTKRVEVGES
jgi:hypothetical protein